MTIQYELGSTKNAPFVVDLCRELHSLGDFRHIPFENETTRNTIFGAVLKDDFFVACAKDIENDTYIGFVGGCVVPFVFSSRLMGMEMAWYVREGTPSRGKVACNLMKAFVKWCYNEHNVVHIQSGDVANINTVAVDGLYRHLGFKRVGTIYRHAPKENV